MAWYGDFFASEYCGREDNVQWGPNLPGSNGCAILVLFVVLIPLLMVGIDQMGIGAVALIAVVTAVVLLIIGFVGVFCSQEKKVTPEERAAQVKLTVLKQRMKALADRYHDNRIGYQTFAEEHKKLRDALVQLEREYPSLKNLR